MLDEATGITIIEGRPTVGTNPISHSRDPETSHEAGEHHTVSGKRGTNARTVLTMLNRWWLGLAPTATALHKSRLNKEGLPLQEIRRRLTDLLHADLVRQGEKRGREVTWELTDRGREVLRG